MATRRKVLALLGMSSVSAPLAAKAAIDATTAAATGMSSGGLHGLGSSALNVPASGGCPPVADEGPFIPYEKRLASASDFIKLTGKIPEVVENSLRDQAKNVFQLDPDIACKRSWSMSVKIAEQRQRNYKRSVERIHESASTQRKFAVIKQILGFDWPF